MEPRVKAAAVQMAPVMADIQRNLEKVLSETRSAAKKGAELIVFPECAITGYTFTSRKEVAPFAQEVPGPCTQTLSSVCRELGVLLIVGLVEKAGEKLFNTAVLIGPSGLIGHYRKNHLPFLGVDRFLDRGDEPFRVYQTSAGNIGIHICYDCNFPEPARIMALMGADILALPTNWPEGRQRVPRLVVPTRALENRVYIIAANRTGTERGTRFIGHSKIVNPAGDTMVEAGPENEETITATLYLQQARKKHLVFKPGQFEVDCMQDRRPELYGWVCRTDAVDQYPE